MTDDEEDVEREIVEETVEETETLDQSGLPADERREQEREALRGGDVELSEASWRKRASEDRSAVGGAVDDLDADEAGRSFDPIPPEPEVDLPEGRTVEGPDVGPVEDGDVSPLPRSDREALEEALEGALFQAVALYDTRRGRVARAVLDRDGALVEEKVVVADGEVRDLGSVSESVDDIEAEVDLSALDERRGTPGEAEPDAAGEPAEPLEPEAGDEAADEEDQEGGGLGDRLGGLLGRGGDEEAAADEDPEPDESPDTEAEQGEDDEAEPEETDEDGGGGLRAKVGGLLARGGDGDEDEEGD